MPSLLDWTPDDQPAVVVDVRAPGIWEGLLNTYASGTGVVALGRVFEIAKEHGVIYVLIERRYIDADWRSEHSHFYTTKFERYPSVCHRLHFFAAEVPSDLTDLSTVASAYRGYSVLRPLESSPVGRTMIAPPPSMGTEATVCFATETVDVLGWPMSITAMPFISQDAQFMRCAHADIWMVSLQAHLRMGAPRWLPADVHRASLGGVIGGRQMPSEGLTLQQMLGALTTLGFSPAATALPADTVTSFNAEWRSLYAIVCRYINSNIPPIVVGEGHVWVAVGYNREPSDGHTRLTLYRHDDVLGPYVRVNDPFNEPLPEHTWTQLVLPLPPKIYLSGERAEASGRWWFNQWIAGAPQDDPVREAHEADELSFVTFGLRARDFKHALLRRPSMDPGLARAYRLAIWPKSLWVVEVQDRRLREAGRPSVLGEVILDPTSSHLDPRSVDDHGILAVHRPGRYISHGPDYGTRLELDVDPAPYESGLRVDPRAT